MRIVTWVLVASCGGPTQEPAAPKLVPAIDAALPDAAVVIDAAVALPAIDAAVESPLVFEPRPPVTGQTIRIAVRQTASIGGVAVSFVSNSHKHPAGRGRTLGMWAFAIARGGAKSELELRDTEQAFEAEIDAKGVLLVFRHVDYDTFEIVLAAAKTPKPLSEAACAELVTQEATKRGLIEGSSSHTGSEHGIVHHGSGRWVGHCGTLTRRVWFTPSARDDDE